jgi:hypothetical protein
MEELTGERSVDLWGSIILPQTDIDQTIVKLTVNYCHLVGRPMKNTRLVDSGYYSWRIMLQG